MMLNQVKVFDGEGNLKQVITKGQLHSRHWGIEAKCQVCKVKFYPDSNPGPQGIFDPKSKTHDRAKMKDRRTEQKYCHEHRREDERKRASAKYLAKVKRVMIPCAMCETPFLRKSANSKNCSPKCGKAAGLKKANEKYAMLRAIRIANKAKEVEG